MKITPKYSYEFNSMLNDGFNEAEQIRNFASLLSDKDRFLILLPKIVANKKLIEKVLGFRLIEDVEFYIVRAEKFKSFSEPITIEYSILPEEMLIFLIKEILKLSITLRFPDELTREQYINSFIDYIAINGDWGEIDLVKFGKNVHDDSEKKHPGVYQFKDIDFNSMTMKQHIEAMFE